MKNNYDDENYIEIIKEYKIKTKDIIKTVQWRLLL